MSVLPCCLSLNLSRPNGPTVGIHVELSRLLLDKWRWLAGMFSRRYVGPQKLDALMKDWAGVEEEEEALAAAEAQASAAAGKSGDAEESEPRVLQVRVTARSIVRPSAGHRLQMNLVGVAPISGILDSF